MSAGAGSVCSPTTATIGTPSARARAATPPTTLPSNEPASRRPSPVITRSASRKRVVQSEGVGDQVEPGDQRAAQDRQRTGQSAGRAGTRDHADVDVVLRQVAVFQVGEPLAEIGDHPPIRALLRAEDVGGGREWGVHVAADDQLRADPVRCPCGSHRGSAAMTWSAPRPPSVVAEPPSPTMIRLAPASVAASDQLAGAGRRRRPRIVPRGAAGEQQPGGQRHLDDRLTVVGQPPAGDDRIAQRAGDGGPAVRSTEGIQRALAAVGQRQFARRAAESRCRCGDCPGGLRPGRRAAELVRCRDDPQAAADHAASRPGHDATAAVARDCRAGSTRST